MKIKRLVPEAKLPEYATAGAAAFDLRTVKGGTISPGRARTFNTGLAFEVPDGHVMLVFSRSGHGFVHDMRLANCVGVIDSDYRGEVRVRLSCDGRAGVIVAEGDRIAQALVLPVERVTFEEVDELGVTERGAAGFGSTGVA